MTSTMLDLLQPDARLERLATGAVWSEGPIWLPEQRRLRWSDIPNNRILEWDAATGETSVFRNEAEYTNGRTLDLQGRVVQCSHGKRALEREGSDGPSIIVDRWAGGRFNSPNDVAVASDGTIWFTDPPYGIHPSGREGHPGEQEYGGCYVFRLDPETSEVTPVVTDMVHPNGIGFSPDESVLYVSDTGLLADQEDARHIRRYPIEALSVSGPGEDFVSVPVGLSDGFEIDEDGRIWTSAGDGVYVFEANGGLIGRIPVPEVVANVTFGGDDRDELFIAASSCLYRIRTRTRGAAR